MSKTNIILIIATALLLSAIFRNDSNRMPVSYKEQAANILPGTIHQSSENNLTRSLPGSDYPLVTFKWEETHTAKDNYDFQPLPAIVLLLSF